MYLMAGGCQLDLGRNLTALFLPLLSLQDGTCNIFFCRYERLQRSLLTRTLQAETECRHLSH